MMFVIDINDSVCSNNAKSCDVKSSQYNEMTILNCWLTIYHYLIQCTITPYCAVGTNPNIVQNSEKEKLLLTYLWAENGISEIGSCQKTCLLSKLVIIKICNAVHQMRQRKTKLLFTNFQPIRMSPSCLLTNILLTKQSDRRKKFVKIRRN